MAPIIKERRHLAGLILLGIGFLLIVHNLKFVPDFIPWWVWTWPFLLITIGTFSLLTSDNKGPGIILIGIGTIFLAPDILDDFWPDFSDMFKDESHLFIYLILIVIGLSLLFRSSSGFRSGFKEWKGRHGMSGDSDFGKENPPVDPTDDATYTSNDFIDEVAIFGGGDKIITSNNFRGGKVTAIFGGTDIILQHAVLAPGVNQLEVFALFGGWTLRIPPHWQVKSEVVAIFGGISDKRYIAADQPKDNTRQLVIKGLVLFGGGEIK